MAGKVDPELLNDLKQEDKNYKKTNGAGSQTDAAGTSTGPGENAGTNSEEKKAGENSAGTNAGAGNENTFMPPSLVQHIIMRRWRILPISPVQIPNIFRA